MKRNLLLLFALLLLSVPSFSQVAGTSFELYVMNYRFGPQSLDYFKTQNIVVTNFLPASSIAQTGDANSVDPAKVRNTVGKLFRKADSGGKLVLDWETEGVYNALRDYPVTDSRYKHAEAEWRKLIAIIREMRPNVEIGIYGMPFNAWDKNDITRYNPEAKYGTLLSLVDFLAPSVYLETADEAVGHERNLQYIRDNMDVALDYGNRLHKPVYPFFWHRIHPDNVEYGFELLQIDVFASYIKFLSTYTYKGYKASGVYWWEALNKKQNLSKADGLGGWAKGTITDYDAYDALMVKYATAVVETLTAPAPQQVVSFTLLDAKTGKEIQTLADGAVLNLADLPTANLNIRANTTTKAGSVLFALSGTQSKNVTESIVPYELMGDDGSWTPVLGHYTLQATPYTGAKATGQAGVPLTVSFVVVNASPDPAPQQAISYTLSDARTGKDIQTLTDGAVLNLADLPASYLNIRANTRTKVGSVVFSLSGGQTMRATESIVPYEIMGDAGEWTPVTGNYTLKATSYSGPKATGFAGDSVTINFTVINTSSLGAPAVASNLSAGSNAIGGNRLPAGMLTVYPVPATKVLYVETGSKAGEGKITIELQDLNGKAVLTKQVHTATDGRTAELDVNTLKAGMYILSVSSSAGRITKRVVIGL
ncbi:T9SS type A sorting domain-containing protein [Pontibacter sp. 172403-2]|uniref:T9SS type A sorting domain-containing protein n=1 Tax=Pontibacter rufus TaxID=2791028 RepID=UPI0018AFC6FB|nr:T9SS type A sorting domain-containing protein [Pontibacter sp. 172403-2]MBF9254228.1 T9SS type A sorting domain-containing protein [Pontibacter sp. 172403-2]